MEQQVTKDSAHIALLRRPRPWVDVKGGDYDYIFHTWMGTFAAGLTPETSEKLSGMVIKLINDVMLTPVNERRLVGEFFDGMDRLGGPHMHHNVLEALRAGADIEVVFFVVGRLMEKLDGMGKRSEYENMSKVWEVTVNSGL